MRLRSLPAEAAWIEAALAAFREAEAAPLAEARPLELLLAGGQTPEPVYRALAALPLRAPSVRIWLSDEREVPAADPGRNGAMIQRAFARCAWRPLPDIRLWPEGPSASAAERYAAELALAFGAGRGAREGRPRFDLALLGVGPDGHTASLFPGEPILGEEGRLAAPSRAPAEPRKRMSLSFPALAASRRLIFLLRGEAKAPMARALEEGGWDFPALGLTRRVEAAGGEVDALYCESD